MLFQTPFGGDLATALYPLRPVVARAGADAAEGDGAGEGAGEDAGEGTDAEMRKQPLRSDGANIV